MQNVNVQTNLYKIWSSPNGKKVTSIHPPTEIILVIVPEGKAVASLYKKGREGAGSENINLDDI